MTPSLNPRSSVADLVLFFRFLAGVGYALTGKETGGVEEQLQRSFEKMAEEEFGIDLKEAKAFEG